MLSAKTVRAAAAALILSSSAAALGIATASAAEAACVVRVPSWDVLWIRARPTTRSQKIGAIPHDACGVRVDWSSCRGAWCRVYYRGVSGWSHTRYLN